jgi:hypothetical protein
MSGFTIEKLQLTGLGMQPASVEFHAGLNIICGVSNTGKSYVLECIDFVFGGDKKDVHFGDTTGYETVTLYVNTAEGRINFSRDKDSNKIAVQSGISGIDSKEYNHKASATNPESISDVWLKLIGITDRHRIISSTEFKKQNLTWRTFSHMFLLKEDAIDKKKSIILPEQNTAKTAALTSLIFLLTGDSLENIDEKEAKRIRDAKKNAVLEYINLKLGEFSKIEERPEFAALVSANNPQDEVEALLAEITATEKSIAGAISQSKELLQSIVNCGESLAECNTLFDRYQALKSQYTADIKRLGFIVDGELNRPDEAHSHKCPFCDSDVLIEDNASYFEAAHAELQRIERQLADLADANSELEIERNGLSEELSRLTQERADVESLIKAELQPRSDSLKEQLEIYSSYITTQNTIVTVKQIALQMSDDAGQYQKDYSGQDTFDPRQYLDRGFVTAMGERLNSILGECGFEGIQASGAYFDIEAYDVVVAGKRKTAQGQGYRGFLNTVMAIALKEVLEAEGSYKPNLLIIDSPIETLSEPGDASQQALQASQNNWAVVADTMKVALFKYLIANQGEGQTVIVETEVPALDYGETNIIKFSHTPGVGRYGLLNDVY